MTGFELYLRRNAKKFDAYLATFFDDGTHPDMSRYLYGPLRVFTKNGGKRHRPLICLLACEAVGGDPSVPGRRRRPSSTSTRRRWSTTTSRTGVRPGATNRACTCARASNWR